MIIYELLFCYFVYQEQYQKYNSFHEEISYSIKKFLKVLFSVNIASSKISKLLLVVLLLKDCISYVSL